MDRSPGRADYSCFGTMLRLKVKAPANQLEMKTSKFSKPCRIVLLLLRTATAEIPIAEHHALPALGRAGQDRLDAGQQRDRGDLVRLGADRARNNQSVAGFQFG